MDRAGKAAAGIPAIAATIIGTGLVTSVGGSGGVLLGICGKCGWRAATKDYLFVSSSRMMDIWCDSPYCV